MSYGEEEEVMSEATDGAGEMRSEGDGRRKVLLFSLLVDISLEAGDCKLNIDSPTDEYKLETVLL